MRVSVLCATVAMTAASVFADVARVESPLYSMDAHDPESPSTSTYVTSSPQLAFKGITRAELVEKVTDGYSLVGNFPS